MPGPGVMASTKAAAKNRASWVESGMAAGFSGARSQGEQDSNGVAKFKTFESSIWSGVFNELQLPKGTTEKAASDAGIAALGSSGSGVPLPEHGLRKI